MGSKWWVPKPRPRRVAAIAAARGAATDSSRSGVVLWAVVTAHGAAAGVMQSRTLAVISADGLASGVTDESAQSRTVGLTLACGASPGHSVVAAYGPLSVEGSSSVGAHAVGGAAMMGESMD